MLVITNTITVHLKNELFNMDKVLVTLSLGVNYTKEYTTRLISDVLNLSDITMYITTDCEDIIYDMFGVNDRIKINKINREELKIRLPIGYNKILDDFNFNLRYLCLEPVLNLDNTVIIFTDCDNSFDWYDKNEVDSFLIHHYNNNGFDFFGPRTDFKWKSFYQEYKNGINPKGIFWHKIFNYDLTDKQSEEWGESPLPAEYLLIFVNNNGKLQKLYDQWKWFHDYLINREWTEGTWAEGFEIGVSSYIAGFKPFDIGWNHPLWSKMLEANGYKTGKRKGVYYPTER